ncbi:MAG: ABC transporter substrate-binding protein [Okeania sp. SIO3I5]|uniref:ABC transporter substrate-binding protein n=1 Tax=Okeania sp. SIO3I5 TaxID=2607805 RepID=UPI0013BAD533|nr:ABC transporter substrate-binding protein [Okeania sp. SIO3I5]NEQ39256.1 ABC transporter substrate-binding protein [Okeania sp. SIO3I5]
MNKILRVKPLRLILLSFIVFVVVSCGDLNPYRPSGETETILENTSAISKRITFGEKSLAFGQESFNPQREKAVRSIADGEDDTATRILTDYLKSKPNDPEARIFLNNLKVKNPYHTIAVSVPISSNLGASQEILRGVAHAQSDWNNSRSVSGGMLKVAIADDDDDNPNNGTKIAEEVATELAKTKEILGVVGHYSSDTSLATANIYEKNQLVSISPISTSVQLIDNTPYFFRTVPSDRAAAQALARYAQAQLNSPKAVVFYNSDSNYSKSLSQEFISLLGTLNIIRREDPDCDLSTWSKNPEDWGEKATEVLKKAKRDSANVLMLAPSSGYLDQALEIVQVNKGNLPVLGGDDVYSPRTLDKGRDSAVKMVVAIAWDIDANETDSDFPKRSQELWGTASVNWRTITAYDATLALAKAIDDQAQPTREGVREKLSSNFSTPGAFKTVKFSDTGDYDGDIQLVEVKKIGSQYDFVPLMTYLIN